MEKFVDSLVGVSYRTFDTVYDLVFTTERVIAYIIQHPSDVRHHDISIVESVILGGIPAKIRENEERTKTTNVRRRSLQEKTLSELLALHPSNFEIRYSSITSYKVTRGLFQSQLRFDVSNPSTRGRTIRFTIAKKQIPEAQRLLGLVLDSKQR